MVLEIHTLVISWTGLMMIKCLNFEVVYCKLLVYIERNYIISRPYSEVLNNNEIMVSLNTKNLRD